MKIQRLLGISVLLLLFQIEVRGQTEFAQSNNTISYKAAVVNDTTNALFFAKKGKRRISLNLLIHDSRNGHLRKTLSIPGESVGLVSGIVTFGDTLILAYVSKGIVSSKLCLYDLKKDSVINEFVFEGFYISDLNLSGKNLSIIGTRIGAKRNETTEVLVYSLPNLKVPISRIYLSGYHGMGSGIYKAHDMKLINLGNDSSYCVITLQGKDTSLVLHYLEGFNPMRLREEYIDLKSEGVSRILSAQKYEERIFFIKETVDEYFVLTEIVRRSKGFQEVELYRSKKGFKMLFLNKEAIYLFSSYMGPVKLMANKDIVTLMDNPKPAYMDLVNTGFLKSGSNGFLYFRPYGREYGSENFKVISFKKLF